MTELSPAAQAIVDAADIGFTTFNVRYAAVLRAAADLVAPRDYQSFTGHLEWDQGMETRNDSVRGELLAIAAELEAQ